MTNEEFAKKYAGKWMDAQISPSAWSIPSVHSRVRIVGYDANSILVETTSSWAIHWNDARLHHHSVVHVVRADRAKKFLFLKQHDLIIPADDEITKPINLNPSVSKPQAGHYPHICPKCGRPSYNAMYGGWIDCSAKCH